MTRCRPSGGIPSSPKPSAPKMRGNVRSISKAGNEPATTSVSAATIATPHATPAAAPAPRRASAGHDRSRAAHAPAGRGAPPPPTPGDRAGAETGEPGPRSVARGPRAGGQRRAEGRQPELRVVDGHEAGERAQRDRRALVRALDSPHDQPQQHVRPEVADREKAEQREGGVAVLGRPDLEEGARGGGRGG